MHRCVALLALLLLIPLAAAAQTTPAPYSEHSAFEVPVAESMRFEEVAKQIVDAAGKAKLKPQYGWGVWQKDNAYVIVSGMQKLAELDDPMAWMRQFENTPGQAVLMEAFGKMNGMHARAENQVAQYMADWSYAPATPVQPAWAEVIEYWPVAGSEEQFNAMTKEAIAILRSTNYPYMVIGHRVVVGPRRAQFVVLFDDPGKHAAADAKLQQNTQWQALGARFMPIVVDMETSTWRYRPELSYRPQ